jgi:hypothetical protein
MCCACLARESLPAPFGELAASPSWTEDMGPHPNLGCGPNAFPCFNSYPVVFRTG